MNYIIVSTSKSDYQEWQIRLLIWSIKKTGQKGKLIVLLSDDTNYVPKPNSFDFDEEIVEVVPLPNWAIEWRDKHDDDWGGIPNKYESFNWVAKHYPFEDDDTLLFLDPDMIFVKPVNHEPKEHEIIGQKWIGYAHLKGWERFSHYEKSFMYPFTLKYSTLKLISKDFKEFCFQVRKQVGKWESDMWGLDYAAKNNNVNIQYLDDFGFCTAWRPNNDKELSPVIHFPNSVDDINNERIFFKQDYTYTPNQPIEISRTRNHLDNVLLTNISQERTDFIYHLKWDFKNIFKFYTGESGYIYLKPYPGGFNNIRMSLEIAICLTYLTNRTLILPEPYQMYLVKGSSDFSTYFDLNRLGIKMETVQEYSQKKGIEATATAIKEVSKVLDFDVIDTIINTEYVPVPSNFKKNKASLDLKNLIGDDDEIVYCDGNLLGSFEQIFHTAQATELKKLIAKHVVYRNDIFDLGWQFINSIGDREYYATHIRRNDFQYKELYFSCERILEQLNGIVPSGATLYIATDHKDKSFFAPLMAVYEVVFYDDILQKLELEDFNVNWIPIVEQLICTRAVKFIGMKFSTLSSYIYRMRGYMNDIEDKYYYENGMPFEPSIQTDYQKDTQARSSWCREYKSIWNLESDTLFVSIASYADKQLIPTIENLLAKAANPNRIVIGVHLQDTKEAYQELLDKDIAQLKILYTPKEEAQGVVWARNEIKRQLFDGEKYFLQIDSHSRFKQGWDNLLVNQHQSIEEPKVILTTYPNAYKISDENEEYLKLTNNSPLKIKQFLNEGEQDNRLRPENLGPLKDGEIVENKWCAAGFLFTKSSWLKDVQLPNNIKFNGEEDLLTHLSFLNGYHLCLTSEATVWHNYNFKNEKTNEPYKEINKNSIEDNAVQIVNEVLAECQHFGKLKALEAYLGITFKDAYQGIKIDASTLFLNKNESTTSFKELQPSKSFRIITSKTANRFAWDISRLQFLSHSGELVGTPISSGFALMPSLDYGEHHAFSNEGGFWGGRPDENGYFWLGIEVPEPTLINQIILDQPAPHFTCEIDIQTKDAQDNWVTIDTKSDLQAGSNTVPIFHENAAPNLKVLVWAINESRTKMEQMCAQLITTANQFEVDINLFGIGTKHTEHKQRIWLLHEYLQNVHPETIILCMDGADTLFNDTSEQLLEKFLKFNTRILISAEKDFTYQHLHFKDRFDAIDSNYRYVNAGTFMGYAGDLLEMFANIIELNEKYPSSNDQGLIGIWASLYLHQPEIVQLDSNGEIFWVTTQDWLQLETVAHTEKEIFNPNTNTKPVIIHCVGNNFPPHRRAYDAAFERITNQNKVFFELQFPSGEQHDFHCSFRELKQLIEKQEGLHSDNQIYIKDGLIFDGSNEEETKVTMHLLIKVQGKYLVCSAALETVADGLGYIPLVVPQL